MASIPAKRGRPRRTTPRAHLGMYVEQEIYDAVEELVLTGVYPTLTAALTAAVCHEIGRPDLAPRRATPVYAQEALPMTG